MTRYTFDALGLDRPGADPYREVGKLLRDHMGGDPFALVCARFGADPAMRRMLDDIRHQAEQLRAVVGGGR